MTYPLLKTLTQRGLAQVAKAAGWELDHPDSARSNYWRYPLYAPDGAVIGYRRKRRVQSEAPKYLWGRGGADSKKPDNPLTDWYILPGTKQAIEAAGGVCYLANGEPSLLAYHAGGVHNAIATTHTETHVPSNAIPYLQQLGVSRLINIADSDQAGHDGARAWRDKLAGSGIDYEARAWDTALGAKADANDAWIAADFKPQAFLAALAACPALVIQEVPQNAPKRPVAQNSVKGTLYTDYAEYQRQLEKLKEDVADALGVSQFQANGFGKKNVSSPFRADSHPSASYNIQSGVLNDFGGVCHTLQELADHFGLPYPQLKRKAQNQTPALNLDAIPADDTSTEAPSDPAAVYRAQIEANIAAYRAGQYLSWFDEPHVPLAWISAMLVLSPPRSPLPVYFLRLHEAFKAGQLNWACFTIADVQRVLDIDYKKAWNVVNALLEMNFFLQFGIVFNDIDISEIDGKNNAGRKASNFAVNTDYAWLKETTLFQLEVQATEKYSQHTLAPRAEGMAHALGLGRNDFKAWQERTKPLVDSQTANAIRAELQGNSEWAGWDKALDIAFNFEIDLTRIETVQDLRVAIMRYWALEVRSQNSMAQMQRLLGCSDGTVNTVRDAANLTTSEVNFTITYYPATDTRPRRVELRGQFATDKLKARFANLLLTDLDNAKMQIQQQLHGYCYMTQVKEFGGTAKPLTGASPSAGMVDYYLFVVKCSSYYREYTEAELANQAEQAQQAVLTPIEAAIAATEAPVVEASTTTTTSTPREASAEIKRSWLEYDYAWLFNQVRLEAVAQGFGLSAEGHLIKDGVVIKRSTLGAVVRYLNENCTKVQRPKPRRLVTADVLDSLPKPQFTQAEIAQAKKAWLAVPI